MAICTLKRLRTQELRVCKAGAEGQRDSWRATALQYESEGRKGSHVKEEGQQLQDRCANSKESRQTDRNSLPFSGTPPLGCC